MITINNNEVSVIAPAGFDKANPLFSYNVARERLHFSDFQCDCITYIQHTAVKYKFILNSSRNIDKLVAAITAELAAQE